jgi:hypothetical protein
LGCISMIQPQPKEPQISLPHKFNGLRSKFRNFVNQVCFVILLHPHWYPTGPTQDPFTNVVRN